MSMMRERAQAQFPTVLLTLISIIQALALELLWSKIISSDFLFEFNVEAAMAWGTVIVTLLGILQIWVLYSTFVIGFTWRPSLRDSLVPFIMGIQEFMLVAFIQPQFNVLFLYVLASIFILAYWISHIIFRRARREPENAQFFRNRSNATWRDFRGGFSVIGVFILFGMVITALGNPNWLALTSLLFAILALIYQVLNSRGLWRELMNLEDEEVIA